MKLPNEQLKTLKSFFGLEKRRLLKVAFTEPVQELIQQVEDLMLQQAESAQPQLGMALDHLLSSGGKRIRVALTLLTGEMLDGDRESLITLSAALELLHTATLVHDDLIDGSLLRRGIPTLNAKWSSSATVLTGDYIFAKAAKLAADVNLIPVMKLFAQTLATIVNGEIKQLFGRSGKAGRSEYMERIYAKTASLFETATKSASIISGADEQDTEKLTQFGYHIGMAFQIVDDILDFTGEQSVIGKPVANDLRQGVITLPAILYLERNPDDVLLNDHIQNGGLDDEEFRKLIREINQSGAIESARQIAVGHSEKGLQMLADFPDNQSKNSLVELSQFIIQRTN